MTWLLCVCITIFGSEGLPLIPKIVFMHSLSYLGIIGQETNKSLKRRLEVDCGKFFFKATGEQVVRRTKEILIFYSSNLVLDVLKICG